MINKRLHLLPLLLFSKSCSYHLITFNLLLLTAQLAAPEVHKYFEYDQLFQGRLHKH